MSKLALTIALGVAATARVAAADIAPPRTDVSWQDQGGDACHLPDRTEPASTCKLLATVGVKGVGTFALYDASSSHDLWVTETADDGTVRVLALPGYASASSAGHERDASHFAATGRAFTSAAGFDLAFDLEQIDHHDGSRARSRERVLLACDAAACHLVEFGAGPWVKHTCTTSGWRAKSTTPRIAYTCTGEVPLD